MVWDWNNPIGLGLFFLMCTVSVIGLVFAVWLLTRVASVASAIPTRRSNNRR